MKKLIWIVGIFLFMLLNACSQDDEPQPADTEVTYEVITSSGKWSGEFNDNNGKRVLPEPITLSSGWRYTFTPTAKPFQMFVFAEAECLCNMARTDSPDVTINFYVNGKLVKSETNNWAKGVTSNLYDIE